MNEPCDERRPPPRRKKLGNNMYVDPRTGNYIWRRTDPRSKKRLTRSTETNHFADAQRMIAKWEDEYERRRVGLAVYDAWEKPLAPLAEEWIKSLSGADKNRRKLTTQIRRALQILGLRTPADLWDPQIEKKVLALELDDHNPTGYKRTFLRRGIQEPLKRFAAWLPGAPHRYIDRNPLADWKPLPRLASEPGKRRRAYHPEDVARALFATDRLDRAYGREYPLRPVFVALLVGGPRLGALCARDVEHFWPTQSRIYTGVNVGKKHRGQCALDEKTLGDIVAYLGKRETGPLFLSPQGARLTDNVLDDWREAFGLGLVDALWPRDEARDFETAWLVARLLSRGDVRVGKGGNPKRLTVETIGARAKQEADVRRIAAMLTETWRQRMADADLHSFRMTHRSWALAREVNPILIDKQLGWSTPTGAAALDAARTLVESPTGRKHYTDLGFTLLDAGRSAKAVRDYLDEGIAMVLKAGTCLAVGDQGANGAEWMTGAAG